MSDRLTIADSKRAFHESFSYVIPPIYRRVTDELLVELHLLSHQKSFAPDPIFAIGLTKTFDSFTSGYRPEAHLNPLFEALCKSNGFDASRMRSDSEKNLELAKNVNAGEIKTWFLKGDNPSSCPLFDKLIVIKKRDTHYSRLFAIGLVNLISSCKTGPATTEDEVNNIVLEICKELGFNKARVEKDISFYKMNLEKITQALELMKESIDREKKKQKNLLKGTDNKINDAPAPA